MMTVERLHDLFDANPDKNALGFEGRCHDCGADTTVTVELTAEGFAIRGGAVYEPEPTRYRNKCERCYGVNPSLSNYRSCEVYSRVVGYLRPVSQWNEGKQAEFGERRAFRTES
jgi:hypothetical protein